MRNIINELEYFNVCKRADHFEIRCPVFIKMIDDYLILKIYQNDDGDYTIKDNGELFKGYQNDSRYYYDLFIKNKGFNYLVELDGDLFFSDYRYDYNVRIALSNFIRFYVYLDDYIISNNLK